MKTIIKVTLVAATLFVSANAFAGWQYVQGSCLFTSDNDKAQLLVTAHPGVALIDKSKACTKGGIKKTSFEYDGQTYVTMEVCNLDNNFPNPIVSIDKGVQQMMIRDLEADRFAKITLSGNTFQASGKQMYSACRALFRN